LVQHFLNNILLLFFYIYIYIFIYNMSGTVGMLVALANFNIKNTTTYYPELYRIKMLILNANKYVATPVTCTYTAGAVNTDFINILYNLTILFPSIYIYYIRSSTNYKFSLNDFFQTTSNITYTVYISQSALTGATIPALASITDTGTNTGTFVFTYAAGGSSIQLFNNNYVPFIATTGASTSCTVSPTTVPAPAGTVTVTVTVTYSVIPTADFGISFNTTAFKNFFTGTNTCSNLTLTSITNVPLSNAGSQFVGITAINTAAIPIIRQGTSLANCFNGCTSFNSNISGWDTSNVTSMASCFSGCIIYNNSGTSGTSGFPLTWNTSRVTDMSYMFYNAKAFNQAITYNAVSQYWNTSAVTTIANIFACTSSAGAFANGTSAVPMLWILTGLSGQPLTATMVTTTSSIYNWRGGVTGSGSIAAPLTFANAPAALTTGPNTGFL
jgi:surface protein